VDVLLVTSTPGAVFSRSGSLAAQPSRPHQQTLRHGRTYEAELAAQRQAAVPAQLAAAGCGDDVSATKDVSLGDAPPRW